MSNAITTTDAKVTEQLIVEYVKNNCINLTDKEFAQFCAVATTHNLNPVKREIYAVKYGTTFNVIVGYEVYLKRAESFPQYDGYETEFVGDAKDLRCICKVFRKDRSRPTTGTAYMTEYNTGKSLWQSKPKAMLEKVAIATALRRAFPSDFDGIPYTSDEMPEPTSHLDPKNEIKAEPAEKPKKKTFSEVIAEERKRVGESAFNKALFDFGVTKLSDISESMQAGFYKSIHAMPSTSEEVLEDVQIFDNEEDFKGAALEAAEQG